MANVGSVPRHHRSEQLHHRDIVRVGRRVVLGNVVVLFWRLEDQGNVLGSLVLQQPSEWLPADLPSSDEHVAIFVGAECPFAVVQVKEGRGFSSDGLEFVQHSFELRRRFSDVVAGRKEMTGIQPITGTGPESLSDVLQNASNLLGGAADRGSCPSSVLDPDPGLAGHVLQRLSDRPCHPASSWTPFATDGSARMKADTGNSQCSRAFQLFAKPRSRPG